MYAELCELHGAQQEEVQKDLHSANQDVWICQCCQYLNQKVSMIAVDYTQTAKSFTVSITV